MIKRIALPDERSLSHEQSAAMKDFVAHRGYEVRGPFVALLQRPTLLTRLRAVGDYIRFESPTSPPLRELAILITASHRIGEYEWLVHSDLGRKAGLAADLVDAIAAGRRPDRMSAEESAVYDLCTDLLSSGAVGDDAYVRALEQFGAPGIVDLVALVGYYALMGMLLAVSHLEPT